MKKIILIVGALALLGAGVGGGMMLSKKNAPPPAGKSTGDEVVADATKAEGGEEGAKEEGKKEGEKAEEGKKGEAGEGGEEGKEGQVAEAGDASLVYSFERDFTVNLADPRGRWFAKVKLQLLAGSAEALQQIQENVPKLRDATIMLISSKTPDDLRPTEGKERLKRELLARYAGVLSPGAIKDIYYDDFTVISH